MRILFLIIIISGSTLLGISQIPKEVQDFDKSTLSNNAKSIIDTFENHRYNYNLDEEKRIESFNNFHTFLTKEAILSDVKVFLSYPDKYYSRLAHYRLLDFGYTKIDLFKLLVDDTEEVRIFYDCVIPPPNEPNWTKTGNYIHSFSKDYSEIEKDSILEVLFLTPNQFTRMKAHYLINLENNSKHINWAIELGKREAFYTVAIPLIKYKFEEEKELILKLLKTWLFEAKEHSTFWNYLSFHFDDVFKKIQYDNDVMNLFYEYHKVKPNRFYAKYIYKYIALQKDTTALRVLTELYYNEKESTSKKYRAHDYIGNLAIDVLNQQTQDTVYKDLYFEIWFDNNYYGQNSPISYIKKQKPDEFDQRIIQYFYEHKGTNKNVN